MFEFLFKYPLAIFEKGKFVLLSGWPVWLLMLLIAVAGGGLFWNLRQRHGAAFECPFHRHLAGPDGADRPGSVHALASGDQRGAAASAGECGRRADRSFPQHGNRRQRQTTRLQQAEDLLNNQLLPDLEQALSGPAVRIRTRCRAHRSGAQSGRRRQRHAHRRQPEAHCVGSRHDAAGRHRAAVGRRRQHRRHRSRHDREAAPAARSGAHHRVRPGSFREGH